MKNLLNMKDYWFNLVKPNAKASSLPGMIHVVSWMESPLQWRSASLSSFPARVMSPPPQDHTDNYDDEQTSASTQDDISSLSLPTTTSYDITPTSAYKRPISPPAPTRGIASPVPRLRADSPMAITTDDYDNTNDNDSMTEEEPSLSMPPSPYCETLAEPPASPPLLPRVAKQADAEPFSEYPTSPHLEASSCRSLKANCEMPSLVAVAVKMFETLMSPRESTGGPVYMSLPRPPPIQETYEPNKVPTALKRVAVPVMPALTLSELSSSPQKHQPSPLKTSSLNIATTTTTTTEETKPTHRRRHSLPNADPVVLISLPVTEPMPRRPRSVQDNHIRRERMLSVSLKSLQRVETEARVLCEWPSLDDQSQSSTNKSKAVSASGSAVVSVSEGFVPIGRSTSKGSSSKFGRYMRALKSRSNKSDEVSECGSGRSSAASGRSSSQTSVASNEEAMTHLSTATNMWEELPRQKTMCTTTTTTTEVWNSSTKEMMKVGWDTACEAKPVKVLSKSTINSSGVNDENCSMAGNMVWASGTTRSMTLRQVVMEKKIRPSIKSGTFPLGPSKARSLRKTKSVRFSEDIHDSEVIYM
eukprot:CAMPEP_0184669008 /NCGR_PEP_ID=MMETSP0308-20130426/75168_1 /TAXON_ID=38269 /ORGANISM="Gloeochaete witrockiana, Strain SAG 46.84" /LENGTH=586 /DNA_ID=CAMNT_0027115037 /DNA_START=331 /DNA_END=2091 /DNA_ORIENTATION=-